MWKKQTLFFFVLLLFSLLLLGQTISLLRISVPPPSFLDVLHKQTHTSCRGSSKGFELRWRHRHDWWEEREADANTYCVVQIVDRLMEWVMSRSGCRGPFALAGGGCGYRTESSSSSQQLGSGGIGTHTPYIFSDTDSQSFSTFFKEKVYLTLTFFLLQFIFLFLPSFGLVIVWISVKRNPTLEKLLLMHSSEKCCSDVNLPASPLQTELR